MPRPSRWPEVVEAAAEEFRVSGYERATLEAIATRVGMLKGSLYNYIENKDDLLLAVIEEPARQLLAEAVALEQRHDQPAGMRLRRLFRAQVRVFVEQYPAAFVYLQQIGRPSHSPRFRRMDDRYLSAIEAIIADGVARGEFSSAVRVPVAARAVVGMLDWMQHWFVPREGDRAEDIADELFTLTFSGLDGRVGAAPTTAVPQDGTV